MKHACLLAVLLVMAPALGAPGKPVPAAKPAAPPSGIRFESRPRPVLAEAGLAASRDPKLFVHAGRLIYMLAMYQQEGRSRLGLFSSSDGGDRFEAPAPISEPDVKVTSSHGENSPSLACGSGGVYVLWERDLPGGVSDLVVSRSLSMGRRFDPPVRVTDKTAPSSNSFSYLAVAPNGEVYAVWLDGRDRQPGVRSGGASLYLARSTDRAATFGRNVRVATGVCPCCRPTVAFGSQGEVFISWRHVFPGDIRDMVVATSTDGGATFAAPARVAEDNWKVEGCPHTGAMMQTAGSRLYITWYSEGTGGNAGIRLAWSDDACKSFSKPLRVSGKLLDTNHPSLSLGDDGKLLLVFQGRNPIERDGWGPIRPYLVEVDPMGRASAPAAVPGSSKSISYPTVLPASLGRVFVAWSETHKEAEQVFLSRGRKSGSATTAAR